jgi:hypothetical protein
MLDSNQSRSVKVGIKLLFQNNFSLCSTDTVLRARVGDDLSRNVRVTILIHRLL